MANSQTTKHEQITSASTIPRAVRSPPVELVLPLPDFLDCFPAPHIGRIVSGLDVLTRPECGVAPHAVFMFQRCWAASSTRRMTWQPVDGDEVSVDVPDHADVKFRVLSSGDGRHGSVAELAAAFPTCTVRVESITSDALRVGDRVRLVRLVWRNAEKCVECRRVTDRKLISVPFSCAAQFTEDVDDMQMSFDDLTAVCWPPRQRRIHLCGDIELDVVGLPPGAGRTDGPAGHLYVGLAPTSSGLIVDARPVDDVATLIRLPDADRRILVAPDAPTTLRPGHSLCSLVTNSRNMLPLVVRVVDWKQQTSVLEHHYVRPGVELIMHCQVQQTKVNKLSLYIALIQNCQLSATQLSSHGIVYQSCNMMRSFLYRKPHCGLYLSVCLLVRLSAPSSVSNLKPSYVSIRPFFDYLIPFGSVLHRLAFL